MTHINVLFPEEDVNIGVFKFKVAQLKKSFNVHGKKLMEITFKEIKNKIADSNTDIEEEVKKILEIINKDKFENIEDLTEVSEFLNNLDLQMKAIQDIIKAAMDKMTLLEKYPSEDAKMSEDEFNCTWDTFARPLEIF
jgi:NAD+--asparagine ADP-ribosyltransferase